MGKYKNRQEIIKDFDRLTSDAVEAKKQYDKAIAALADIFTTDLKYTDRNGEEKVSKGLSQAENPNKLLEDLFRDGTQTLREVGDNGGCQWFMTWYCISKGITHDQIMSLATKPDEPETKELRNTLAGMREDFRTLMNGNDPEKLSQFFLNTFKAFAREIPPLLEGSTADIMQQKTTRLLLLSGAGSVLQQSLEAAHGAKTETQTQLIDKLNTGIKAEFGQESSLRDVLATLYPFHSIYQNLFVLQNSEPDPESRMKMLNKLRDLDIMKTVNTKCRAEGRELKVFSSEMGKAAVVNMFGYLDFDDSEHPEVCQQNSEPLLSEMKAVLGDNTGVMLYDSDHLTDYEHTLAQSDMSVGGDADAQARFFGMETFEDTFVGLKNGGINAVVDRKMKTGEALSKAEILAFISRDNAQCTDSDRELIGDIMEEAGKAARGEQPAIALPGDIGTKLTYVVNAMVKSNFGRSLQELGGDKHISAEDFRLMKENRTYFRELADLNTGRTLPEENVHERNAADLTAMYNKASKTLFSSGDFKNLSEAFLNLKRPDAGHEQEYRAQLDALREAAKQYIEAKQRDGKRVRSTQRGRDRMEFARRAMAFADTTLKGMDVLDDKITAEAAKDSLLKSRELGNVIGRRIDDMFGPKPQDNNLMLRARIYKKGDLDLKEMKLPKECPFTDHEVALIGFAQLTDGQFFRNTHRNNTNMTNKELGEAIRVHSTTDVFVNFRPGAGVIVQQFGSIRTKAAELIQGYMDGNKKPLAEAVGSNIRATVRNMMMAENLTDTMRGDFYCLSETAKLLRDHPDLMKDCGLTEREQTLMRFFERVGTMLDAKNTALEKLKDKTLPVEDMRKAMGDVLAFELARTDFVKSRDEAVASPEYERAATEVLAKLTETSRANNRVRQLEQENAKPEDIEAAKLQHHVLSQAQDFAQFHVEAVAADRPLSPMMTFIGGEGTLQSKMDSITEELMKTDAFKQMTNESSPSKVTSAAIKEMSAKQSLLNAPRNEARQEQVNVVQENVKEEPKAPAKEQPKLGGL